MNCIMSKWSFNSNCMIVNVRGEVDSINPYVDSQTQAQLLLRAVQIIEIAEQNYKGIVMADGSNGYAIKGKITIGFGIIFESELVANEFVMRIKENK